MQLSNNVILLTGGTSGIGLELARRFYKLGNTLIISSGNRNNLDNLEKELPGISTIECDLANASSVLNLIDRCREAHKDINVLVNNAGVQYNYTWLEGKEDYQRIADEIAINLTSPMQLIYGLLPVLNSHRSAAIVNVSSALAFAPKKSAPVYCGTKAAVHNTTKALRYQLENTRIKVFEIIPPLVDTAMTQGRVGGKISPAKLVDEFLKNFKNDRFESNIGKARLLRFVQRISPRLADNILKNG